MKAPDQQPDTTEDQQPPVNPRDQAPDEEDVAARLDSSVTLSSCGDPDETLLARVDFLTDDDVDAALARLGLGVAVRTP